jgi:hypothetical protein
MLSSKKVIRLITVLAGLLFLISANGQEQVTDSIADRENAVKIFIDCIRCDMNYIREEIPYVNYVRDVREAQVYIRETSEMAGSGGRKYTYVFTGQMEFEGKHDTLFYDSRPDEPRDLRRIWQTQMMKMGLMPYVARTPLFTEVIIEPSERMEKEVVVDRWNNWVFELEAEPDFEGEESYRELSLRSSVSATKISHAWKLEFDFDNRITRTKYTYDDTVYTTNRSYQGLDVLVVKSLTEHWSAGIRTDLLASSYNNINFSADILPSVEYNIFPYSESTHRQLRILYGIGSSYRKYNSITIYDKMEELLWLHQLQLAYQVREKWGSINVALEGSNFFHDFGGAAARVNDQLSLVKGEASEAEILLRLQELQTSFNVEGEVSLTYTFGSIYNNIVNPRFGNGRRRYR